MNAGPDLSKIASLIADPSRAKILASLMNLDGLPATELAVIAGITPQTASSHLGKMVKGKLLKVTKMGRHRYYSIASEDVAKILENMALLAPAPLLNSSKDSREHRALKFARTCYGHLAGEVGVSIYQEFLKKEYLEPIDKELRTTKKGNLFFEKMGLFPLSPVKSRRAFACTCLDWTERKFHLAGTLGAELALFMLTQKWVRRISGSRALTLTEKGRIELKNCLQLNFSSLAEK